MPLAWLIFWSRYMSLASESTVNTVASTSLVRRCNSSPSFCVQYGALNFAAAFPILIRRLTPPVRESRCDGKAATNCSGPYCTAGWSGMQHATSNYLNFGNDTMCRVGARDDVIMVYACCGRRVERTQHYASQSHTTRSTRHPPSWGSATMPPRRVVLIRGVDAGAAW